MCEVPAPPNTGGLTPSPGQGKIKYVCFHPLTTNRDGEMRRAVRAASIITALSCTSAWADDPTLLEKYKEWSAFAASGTPKVCFALAQPKTVNPQGHQARSGLLLYLAVARRRRHQRGERQDGLSVRPRRQGHRSRSAAPSSISSPRTRAPSSRRSTPSWAWSKP